MVTVRTKSESESILAQADDGVGLDVPVLVVDGVEVIGVVVLLLGRLAAEEVAHIARLLVLDDAEGRDELMVVLAPERHELGLEAADLVRLLLVGEDVGVELGLALGQNDAEEAAVGDGALALGHFGQRHALPELARGHAFDLARLRHARHVHRLEHVQRVRFVLLAAEDELARRAAPVRVHHQVPAQRLRLQPHELRQAHRLHHLGLARRLRPRRRPRPRRLRPRPRWRHRRRRLRLDVLHVVRRPRRRPRRRPCCPR
ncbi:hypothetical protein Mp_8g17170 [Marchantia polymorpha subsp. ruderalis]|uniref:Uncharacterized protein n=1 Tax=Marchantia polymorpha TaxID=3197 RepID=A0A2R6X870_MARPO|nr:hypothetical protein MARPO_0030s0049 [Marchantia polymorpha]BBN20188.1 hypothetical protein Mp_8g17170 [Marchantia polymorpha subsp. ruderalis]|eukprot:PTQ42304.1 hypothetical protein MARPO_0030s0049 [Marchantia polymorpha]